MEESRPVVAVWKSTWLPPSQTFVRNQLQALTRWDPLLLGVRRVADGLPVVPDLAPFGSGPAWRAAHRLSASTGYRGVYDRTIRRRRPRLLHAHFGTSAVPVLPVVRRHGMPLVVTFHGYDVTREPRRSDPRGARYRDGLAAVFGYADALIAVSDFLADRLMALGAPPSKVRVHHIGIPVTPAPQPARREGIVFVGRLVDVKGVGDLIDAVAGLRAEHRSVPVRVIGDGPRRTDAQAAADRHGLQVEFLGYRPPSEVAEVLGRSAVFCAPSKTAPGGDAEAFGMVFLEAALAGLPVVAYRHGGVPEAVADGRTGLLAPEGDVAALTAHLGRLLDDPVLARQLGAEGRARVLRDFDVSRQTALLEDLYDETAGRARAG